MKTCLIISGGSHARPPVKIEYDFCIACDSGYENARQMGITPNIILGDFDSSDDLGALNISGLDETGASDPSLEKTKKENIRSCTNADDKKYEECLGYKNSYKSSITLNGRSIPTISFPKEKDDTDTMLAVKYAISLGFDKIILSCCLGGRFDHTMANIQSMAYAASHGCICELTGTSEWMRTITPKDGECRFPRREKCSLSLFSLSNMCGNLYLRGAKYCAEGVTLTNDFPLGHGNSWEEDEIRVSISSGILLLIESDMSKEE